MISIGTLLRAALYRGYSGLAFVSWIGLRGNVLEPDGAEENVQTRHNTDTDAEAPAKAGHIPVADLNNPTLC